MTRPAATVLGWILAQSPGSIPTADLVDQATGYSLSGVRMALSRMQRIGLVTRQYERRHRTGVARWEATPLLREMVKHGVPVYAPATPALPPEPEPQPAPWRHPYAR